METVTQVAFDVGGGTQVGRDLLRKQAEPCNIDNKCGGAQVELPEEYRAKIRDAVKRFKVAGQRFADIRANRLLQARKEAEENHLIEPLLPARFARIRTTSSRSAQLEP
ncbi:hypothetical protein AAF712_005192 [Marasmius tenuissimus]|uniref:Uncharacterized protein n=1 Tax=Marasmius tenuissimus TaxID=585030 RepID=A0ABR3A5E1_9AGAR